MGLNRLAKSLTGLAIAALIVLDRMHWARLAQWREDQATQIWMGYTIPLKNLTVGLISSVGTPTPNGFPLVGKFLSMLPGLFSVSLFLGCLQALLIVVFACKLSRSYALRVCVLGPLLSLPILRGCSVEFWNQWFLIDINLFFWILMNQYHQKPTWRLLPWFMFILIIPVATYLGGVPNTFAFAVIALATLFMNRPIKQNRGTLWFGLIGAAFVLIFFLYATWIPYFRFVQVHDLHGLTSLPLSRRIWISIMEVLEFPKLLVSFWRGDTILNWFQMDMTLLSLSSHHLVSLLVHLFRLQALFFIAATVIYVSHSSTNKNHSNIRPLYFVASTLILMFFISPLLNGPTWSTEVRADQNPQFIPGFLFLIFAGPILLLSEHRHHKIALALTLTMSLATTVLAIKLGNQVYHSQADYSGDHIGLADVPLTDKMAAVKFIAKDWSQNGKGSLVTVRYDLAGDFSWLKDVGKSLAKYYPSNPFTVGRALDYELLRVYGLSNSDEGLADRPEVGGHYQVGYASKKSNTPGIDHYFGRIRVTVAPN